MSEPSERLTSDELLVREADAWVMLIASGRATHGDAAALDAWRARSMAHERAYVQSVKLRHSIMAAARDIRDEDARRERSVAPGVKAQHVKMPSRRRAMHTMMAASAAGLAVVLGGPRLGLWAQSDQAEFSTRKGERRVVSLDGGARLELNTATRLSRRPDLGPGAVELFDGEMMLTAPKNADRPVLVLAGGGRTMAPGGARVALRCQDDAVSVTCLAGRAIVQMGQAERSIVAGQQLRYDDAGLGEPVAIDPEVVTAWQRGVLVFRRARVGDVMAEIGRYREGRIVIANASLADRRIDGTFPIGRTDAIFDQLRSAYGARITNLPGEVVVLT